MRFFVSICSLAIAGLIGLPDAGVAEQGQAPQTVKYSLRDAISEALRHSPQLSTTEDATATARIQQQVAEARYRPAITPTLNTGAAPSGLAQQNFGLSVAQLLPTGTQVQASANSIRYGSGAGDVRDTGYTIGFSQPLLRGFGAASRADLKNAQYAVEGAGRNSADARQQLVVSVAHAYYNVVRQERLADIGDRAVQRAAKLAEMSEARARVGLSTQLDVLRARLLQSQAQAAAFRDHDALDAAREDLNVLIGRQPESPLDVEGDLAADLRELECATGRSADVQADMDNVLAENALRDRLDMQSARARVSEARWSSSVAQWNLLPQLNLDVTYTRRGLGASPLDAFGTLMNGWRVGLSSTYSLDRSRESASAVLAQVSLRGAERTLTETQNRVATEVHRSSRSLARAGDAVALQRNAMDLAEQQRDLATLRFERGLADNIEVVDAENNVFQAEAALLGAEIDRNLAFVALQRACGTLEPDRFLQ